jgi:hypothetical protein
MRRFLDANVLFSAARSDGAARALLVLLFDAGHECWADDYVVTEARRNLVVKGPEALAAIRLRCDALVTGDSTHFGRGYGKSFGGVAIHSPRSLAESILV